MRGPTGAAKDLHDWIEKGGYGTAERATKGGHVFYRLRNGARFIGPMTASGPRVLQNGKAEVRRLLRNPNIPRR